jgi:hypothetical protein
MRVPPESRCWLVALGLGVLVSVYYLFSEDFESPFLFLALCGVVLGFIWPRRAWLSALLLAFLIPITQLGRLELVMTHNQALLPVPVYPWLLQQASVGFTPLVVLGYLSAFLVTFVSAYFGYVVKISLYSYQGEQA